MNEYDDLVIETFIKEQKQLFSKEIVTSKEEAAELLEDMMAVVCKNKKEVKQYFEEVGSDIFGMSDQEILGQGEVFAIPDGRYLIVEG